MLRDGDKLKNEWLPGERVDAGDVHGTGCALSAAIAANLARGLPLRDSVESARRFVLAGLRNARAFGGGARFLVPA